MTGCDQQAPLREALAFNLFRILARSVAQNVHVSQHPKAWLSRVGPEATTGQLASPVASSAVEP